MIDKRLILIFKNVTALLDDASGKIEEWTETVKEKTDALEVSTKLPPIVQEQIEMLRMSDLKAVIRAHMPKNANAVATNFTKTKTANRLTLTYLKDREILPIEENKLIVVTGEFVSREVESLFNDKSVVILQ